MKKVFYILAASLLSFTAQAQKKVIAAIDELITRPEAEAHLTFLAADEMRGRDAGSPELDIAANYIRTQFRLLNIKPAPNTNDYFQPVDLVKQVPVPAANATIGSDRFVLKENMLVLEGEAMDWKGDLVYVGYGSPEELAQMDLKGKMVLALAGSKDADNMNKVFMSSREKYATIQKMGAAGLVEFLALPQVPWPALVNFLGQTRWGIKLADQNPAFIWLKPQDVKSLAFTQHQPVQGSVSIQGVSRQMVPGKNVAGLIEGTDPKLKNEYIVITAHYDHVGVDSKRAQAGDSIFNGARDNATGTVALLQAAKYLSKYPSKRSVILLAVTCEEKGLLGSQWYAKHPLVPLKNTVLNLNSDGVGYNDKTRVTSISLGRTNMDDLLTQAAKQFSFTLGGDPDPREGFYERSDQVSFAKEGVPAIKLQPGLAKMDQDIMKYYHRQADEVSNLDLDYITQFYKTFVYAVHLITNDTRKPAWVPGDKFEAAAKKLYGN